MTRILLTLVIASAALSAQPRIRARVNQVEKFSRMTPQERKSAIKDLPPKRQEQIERNVERYNSLTPEQKKNLQGRLERFNQLSPGDQQRARKLFRDVSEMQEDRRFEVRREMARLRHMDPEKRKERLNDERYKNKYSPDERRVIEELTELKVE